MTNIIECFKIPNFSTIHMGVVRKWHFSTSGGAANLGGVSGDLSDHRGSGITLLGITSLFMHKLTGLLYQMVNYSVSCSNRSVNLILIKIVVTVYPTKPK